MMNGFRSFFKRGGWFWYVLMLTIVILSILDNLFWHSKNFPGFSYATVGPWHNCSMVPAVNNNPLVIKLVCTEGEIIIENRP